MMSRQQNAWLPLVVLLLFASQRTQAEDQASPTSAVNVLIISGHDAPVHIWRETSGALVQILVEGRQAHPTVVTDPEVLAVDGLSHFQAIVLNYCNWERDGLSEKARQNLLDYLAGGGGLAIVHFANGAFQPDLPGAGEGDWPEYRKICRRYWVWNKSSHDPYGPFHVDIAPAKHPITENLKPFETVDELYIKQGGDQEVTVLATAKSVVTGQEVSLAFAYHYGPARVFQTTLGHSADAIRKPGTAMLMRRGILWAAGGLSEVSLD